jgi:hypothetical protein
LIKIESFGKPLLVQASAQVLRRQRLIKIESFVKLLLGQASAEVLIEAFGKPLLGQASAEVALDKARVVRETAPCLGAADSALDEDRVIREAAPGPGFGGVAAEVVFRRVDGRKNSNIYRG